MKINHKLKRVDFIVHQVNILKNYNTQSLRTLGNGDHVPAYEISRHRSWFFGLFKTTDVIPIVRFESLKEVEAWLLIETGEEK